MSFGGTPGDVTIVISFAAQLYRKCKNAGGEYLEVAREVGSLHTVLRHLKYEIEAPESLLNRDKSKYGAQLIPIIGNCDYTLQQLDELLRKYHRLADEKPGTWDRIRFGSAEMDSLGNIRMKLNNHKTTVTVFLDTVQLHYAGRVSKTLDGHGGQLDVILDKVDKIAERMGQRAGSMLTSYGNDDKEVWKEFRRELVAEGFSSEVLQRNKDVLRAYIREIDQKGLLVEAPLTPASASQSVSPEWLKSVSPAVASEHSPQNEGMKEIVRNELNMKFPQSMKDYRGRSDSKNAARDLQHGISALTVDMKADGDNKIMPSPVVKLHSAPEATSINLEHHDSSSDDNSRSKHPSQGTIIRTSDVTNFSHSADETKFLKAPQPRRPVSLQPQAQPSDRSRSNSPASIKSQTSDRSKSGSYPSDELSTNRVRLCSSATSRTSEQSRSPGPSSGSLAPDAHGNPIPPDAKWTKIKRSLVSLEVLEQDGYRYEARPEFVAVLGVLGHEEIEGLALRTKEIREARRQHTREAPRTQQIRNASPSPRRKPPQNFRFSRSKKTGRSDSSSNGESSDSSSEPDQRHLPPPKERRKRSSHSPVGNEQPRIPRLLPSPVPDRQPSPVMWSPTSPPPGWHSSIPVEPHPYNYTPPGYGMEALPNTKVQPMYSHPPQPPSFSPNLSADSRNHRSRRHEKHQSHGKNGKKDTGRNNTRWRENLTAAGMGGAAVSLLSVLSEAAAGL